MDNLLHDVLEEFSVFGEAARQGSRWALTLVHNIQAGVPKPRQRLNERPERTTACLRCGTVFERNRMGQPAKYCSRKCESKANHVPSAEARARKNQRQKEKLALWRATHPKSCKLCGAPYANVGASNQRYCTEKCATLARRKRDAAAHRARRRN